MTRTYSTLELERAVEWFDWAALLEECGISAYVRGDELVAPCPFCHHEGRESFFLNSISGVYFCHVCGATGGPVKIAARLMGLSYADATKRLMYGNIRPLDLDDAEDAVFVDTSPLIALPDEYLPLTGDTSITSRRYSDYLNGRGVGPELIERYSIGFCATGHLAGYVIVPVHHLGQLITYIARATNKKTVPKVWTPPGNEEGNYLFNLDNLWGTKSVVVMEGVFDALVLPDIAVATFGKKISDAQLLNLKAAGVKELILCWDEDAAEDIHNTAQRIARMFVVKVVYLPAGKDPSDLGSAHMHTLIQGASPDDGALGSSPDGFLNFFKHQ